MRILYLTQWFEPEPAFKGAQFAEELARRGFDVEVATGFPNYPGGRLYPGYKLRPYRMDGTAGEIPVHRLWLYPSHNRSPLRRALNYLSFFLSSLIFGLVRGWRYDIVYVYHPPITPSLAMALISRLYGFRLILDIQDLWPDSVAASGMASKRTSRILERICRFVYRRADHIITQSDGMRQRLIDRGVPSAKISRIYNWATYRPNAAVAAGQMPDDFADAVNVVYGGNLGQAQALMHVVRAAEVARHVVPTLRLHFFGDGIERDMLLRSVEAHPGADARIHGPVDRQRMDRVFDHADILIMHLKRDPLYEFTIPSKTQHYMACAKPIIAGINGEAAIILEQSGGAVVCPPEDDRALAAALIELGRLSASQRQTMGRRARDHYQAHFSMASAIDQTVAIFGLAQSASARPNLSNAKLQARGNDR
jgi:glycosyltransferase involved in cell wall biosynthesis